MQHAVDDIPKDFVRVCKAEFPGASAGRLGGYDDFAFEFRLAVLVSKIERKNVGRTWIVEITFVKRGDGRVINDRDTDRIDHFLFGGQLGCADQLAAGDAFGFDQL